MDAELKKWLWLDLEMTGLDVEEHRIIEAAAIVTDTNLNELANWHAVIKQGQEELDKMKDAPWFEFNQESGKREKVGTVYDMHVESGVIEAISQFGRDEEEVMDELAKFIETNFEGLAILAGNSIHNDRRFITSQWPDIDKLLHYRMLDVTALKISFASKNIEYKKEKAHNALDDIRASIAELKHYLSHVS